MQTQQLTPTQLATHGGKLFFEVDVPGTHAGTVRASSCLEDGTTLPTEVLRTAADSCLVTVPCLTASQELTVQALDGNGEMVAQGTVPVSAPTEQMQDSPDIADLERKLAPFNASITRIVSFEHELLVTMVIEAFPFAPRQALAPIIAVHATNGELLTTSYVDLGTSCRPDYRYPSEYRYLSTLSFRIPDDTEAIVVGITLADMTKTLAFDAQQLSGIRDATYLSRLPADLDPRYHDWYHVHHKANDTDLYLQRLASANLPVKPLFSLIVPLYQTPLDFFDEMAQSALAQTYPHLELILVNASPEREDLCQAVEALCVKDRRVRHVPLESNLGITENTNAGIRAATGDFVAFLDHDDIIEPDLLYHYAKGINDYPTTDLLYCDEDHLLDGRHVSPFFKPDWDPNLLCSENYVCHMLCVRKALVDALPQLPDRRYDGAQDHNLTFLIGEQARNVFHARRIMYHWRMHENSTASEQGAAQKPYAIEAQRLVVQEHLDRCGIKATAVMGEKPPYRCSLRYHYDEHPLVSIVIPNKDAVEVLDRCLTSIEQKTTWPNYEVVVVENNSTSDETFAYYEQATASGKVRVITSETGGVFDFSKVVNDGCAAAKGNYLLMLNNDTEVLDPNWLQELMGPIQSEDIGAVGCKLLYPDDTYQHVGVAMGRTSFGPFHADLTQPDGFAGYYECDALTHRASAVTGACLLTRRDVFDLVGGLDEQLPVNYNDVDYCMRLREKGYASVVVLSTCLRHYESLTRPSSVVPENISGLSRDYGIFMCRWQRYLTLGDPYYNQNLRASNAYHALEL